MSYSFADVSELFLHATSDYTDKLSFSEDLSTRTLGDFKEHLQRAKEHDLKMKKSRLPLGITSSSHSTPIPRHPRHARSRSDFSRSNEPVAHRDEMNDIDSGKLYEMFEQFLKERMAKHKPKNQSRVESFNVFETPIKKNHEESELDSGELSMNEEVEDTFDHEHRKQAGRSPKGQQLPETTPPQSSGTNFENTDETIADRQHEEEQVSDVCKPFEMPKVELEDVDVDDLAVDANYPKRKSEAPPTIAELKKELEQKTEMNQEQANEISYLRSQLQKMAVSQYASSEKNKTSNTRYWEEQKTQSTQTVLPEQKQSQTQTEKEVETPAVTAETVDPQFRPYYERLGLAKVDTLLDVEKGNVIKNMMLSMLVTDFEHLDTMAPKIGDYMRLSLKFLDAVHEQLYGCSEFRPLRYLRDYRVLDMGAFQDCLDEMLCNLEPH